MTDRYDLAEVSPFDFEEWANAVNDPDTDLETLVDLFSEAKHHEHELRQAIREAELEIAARMHRDRERLGNGITLHREYRAKAKKWDHPLALNAIFDRAGELERDELATIAKCINPAASVWSVRELKLLDLDPDKYRTSSGETRVAVNVIRPEDVFQ